MKCSNITWNYLLRIESYSLKIMYSGWTTYLFRFTRGVLHHLVNFYKRNEIGVPDSHLSPVQYMSLQLRYSVWLRYFPSHGDYMDYIMYIIRKKNYWRIIVFTFHSTRGADYMGSPNFEQHTKQISTLGTSETRVISAMNSTALYGKIL